MSFRFRPSIEVLEFRDNPSGPDLVDPTGTPIDPNTGLPVTVVTNPPTPTPPPPGSTPTPVPTDPTQTGDPK